MCENHTPAGEMIRSESRNRFIYMICASIVSLILIVGGCWLTIKGVNGAFEFTAKQEKTEIHLVSLAPGLFLQLCGTAIMCAVILKRCRFKTQHKDETNKIPGFTEVET